MPNPIQVNNQPNNNLANGNSSTTEETFINLINQTPNSQYIIEPAQESSSTQQTPNSLFTTENAPPQEPLLPNAMYTTENAPPPEPPLPNAMYTTENAPPPEPPFPNSINTTENSPGQNTNEPPSTEEPLPPTKPDKPIEEPIPNSNPNNNQGTEPINSEGSFGLGQQTGTIGGEGSFAGAGFTH